MWFRSEAKILALEHGILACDSIIRCNTKTDDLITMDQGKRTGLGRKYIKYREQGFPTDFRC